MQLSCQCPVDAKRSGPGVLAVEGGMTVTAACLAFRVSRRWLGTIARPGGRRAGRACWTAAVVPVVPRSGCRWLRNSKSLSSDGNWAGAPTSWAWLGIPASTVHRAIRRLGL